MIKHKNIQPLKDMTWKDHQKWESLWHGNCINTFGEETKQISYAHRMGLINNPVEGHWPVYDLSGKSVLDIGGGPASLLLKTVNAARPTVVDPCPYPKWVAARYKTAGIEQVISKGEDFLTKNIFDECWIYNVLQHADDPKRIVLNARKSAKIIRIFDWVDIAQSIGHPHVLKSKKLDEWLGGKGIVEVLNGENGCYGSAYYGVF